jgi:hypothetical protein
VIARTLVLKGFYGTITIDLSQPMKNGFNSDPVTHFSMFQPIIQEAVSARYDIATWYKERRGLMWETSTLWSKDRNIAIIPYREMKFHCFRSFLLFCVA